MTPSSASIISTPPGSSPLPRQVVCIATEQMTTNLVPLAILQAERVFVIQTRYAEQEGWADFLKRLYPDSLFVACSEAAEQSPDRLADEVVLRVDAWSRGQPVAFVWSGGTKPLSTGVFLAFRKLQERSVGHVAVYPDLQRKQLQVIRDGGIPQTVPLLANLTVQHILQAAGFTADTSESTCLYRADALQPWPHLDVYRRLSALFYEHACFRELCARKAVRDSLQPKRHGQTVWERIVSVAFSHYLGSRTSAAGRIRTDLQSTLVPSLTEKHTFSLYSRVQEHFQAVMMGAELELNTSELTHALWSAEVDKALTEVRARSKELAKTFENKKTKGKIRSSYVEHIASLIAEEARPVFQIQLSSAMREQYQRLVGHALPERLPIEALHSVAIVPNGLPRPRHFATHFEGIVAFRLHQWLVHYLELGGKEVAEVWLTYKGSQDVRVGEFEWDAAILLKTGRLIVLDSKTIVKDTQESKAQKLMVFLVGGRFAVRREVLPRFQEDLERSWLPDRIRYADTSDRSEKTFLDHEGTFEAYLRRQIR